MTSMRPGALLDFSVRVDEAGYVSGFGLHDQVRREPLSHRAARRRCAGDVNAWRQHWRVLRRVTVARAHWADVLSASIGLVGEAA